LHPALGSRPEDVPDTPESLGHRAARGFVVLCAVLILALGLLPIANWIPGGHDAPWFRGRVDEWLTGSMIAVGAAVVLTILARRVSVPVGPVVAWVVRVAVSRPSATGWVIAGAAFVMYAAVALGVFSGVPLHLDELTQVIQARIFAQGRLSLDAPAHPEFTSLMHMLDLGGKRFTQFPPGGPLLLLPAVWLGAPWLTGPLCGTLSVRVFWEIVRRAGEQVSVTLGATLLFAFAPFVVFMSGSHMNHVGALLFALLAIYGWLRCATATGLTPRYALLSGLALGAMGSIRPVDALAFAVPIGGWYLWQAMHRRERRDLAALVVSGVGVLIPLLLLAVYNARTTGSPFSFAYEVQWGASHALGFHAAPWGFAHTPMRGLELVNVYFLRLQTYLFESPVPSLLFPCAALIFMPRLRVLDRLWLCTVAMIGVLYFAYWHDGFYLGPRFFYLMVPPLVWWTARLPGLVGKALEGKQTVASFSRQLLVVSTLMALIVNVPLRLQQYRAGLSPMRVDATRVARDAGVSNALIFVRESWGAQLLARLWALDVPRSEAELLYQGVDACALEEAIGSAEHSPGQASFARFAHLLTDSSRLVPSSVSPDVTERMLPGARYSPRCLTRIADDQGGFTLLAPLLAKDWATNIYARDLHERDSLLLRDYPTRPVYLLRSAGPESGAPLELIPLRRDSLFSSWRSSLHKQEGLQTAAALPLMPGHP
jgi:hypothetical protein